MKEFLGGANPIGKSRDRRGRDRGRRGDLKNAIVAERPVPAEYHAFDQLPTGYLSVIVRSTRRSRERDFATARKRLAAIDNTLPLVRRGIVRGALAVDVAVAVRVGARRRVLGVRAAARHRRDLQCGGVRGAAAPARVRHTSRARRGASQVMRLVLSQAASLAALGVVCGLVVAISTSSALRSMLYGVGATDGGTYAAACAIVSWRRSPRRGFLRGAPRGWIRRL